MKKLESMFSLQAKLNNATNGIGWENGKTKNGKIIDWKRCIYLEAAELIESYPWKHWKNIDAKPDYENIKIEVVDIWHFVMSEVLRIYKVEQRGSIKDLTVDISKIDTYDSFSAGKILSVDNYYLAIELIEEFVRSIFCNKPIEVLVGNFFKMAQASGLVFEEMYTLYIGKNILNQFRQDYGYKEGMYHKIWGTKEDNVVMQEILSQNIDISPQELYGELQKRYPAS